MLRKFPVQTPIMRPPNMMDFPPQNKLPIDPEARKEIFGEQLYNKISLNPNYAGISKYLFFY